MRWIHDYQLFLFDFDGLLVNTEEIHFLAYKRMCSNRGYELDWDFPRYCQAAHYDADALRQHVYERFPDLYAQEPNWNVLYAEKKQAMRELLTEGVAQMMPGASELLTLLQKHHIQRCVVTHSPDDLVQIIRKKNPILNTIPNWITREHYSRPKPDPECYHIAIEKFSKPGNRVIGFEDTPRGIRALLETSAQPVLICQADYPEIPEFLQQGAKHYPSLTKMLTADERG